MSEKITLFDGTQVAVPEGMSDGELTNYIARKMPHKALEQGIVPDIEREYDIRSGVQDWDTRFGVSLAQNNPEEVKAELDNQYGKGNWGFSDFNNQPYVTADGLRKAGIETTSDRKVLVDGTSTDFYDLLADPFPELVIGGASVAAEVALPMLPGSGLIARGFLSGLVSRGIVASSGRAGAGAAAGSMGVEGLQTLRGTQQESLGEQLQDAGTEGLFVGLGSMVLGAPLAAMGGVAKRVNQASKDMPAGAQNISSASVEQAVAANNRNRQLIYDDYIAKGRTPGAALDKEVDDDVLLISARTLIGDQGTMAGNIMSKIEGIGVKVEGDNYSRKVIEFMNKMRAISVESARRGEGDFTTLARLKTQLTKEEQEFAKNTMDKLNNFQGSKLANLDEAASAMSSFKKFANQTLLSQYKAGQKAFNGDKFYGQFKNLDSAPLTAQQVADAVNNIADGSELLAQRVVNALSSNNKNSLGPRINSRIEITDNGLGRARVRRNKKDEPIIDKETGQEIPASYKSSQITLNDLYLADRAIRRESYSNRADANFARENLQVSNSLLDEIGDRLPKNNAFRKELIRVNKEYAKFANVYKGKKGLFGQVVERAGDDPSAYIKNFVNGSTGRSLKENLNALESAFGTGESWTSTANALGIDTKDQLLSYMGMNFVNTSVKKFQNRIARDGVRSVETKQAARAELNYLNKLEDTIVGKVDKSVVNQIFEKSALSEYKTLLRRVATGSPAQSAKAVDELGLALDFKGAQSLVAGIEKIGRNLSGENLNNVVASVRQLNDISPKSAEFYKDLLWSQNWSRIIDVESMGSATQKNSAIKAWADDWITARNNADGVTNMQELFGKDMYSAMDDLALNIRGALNIDPNAGALSIAEIVPGIARGFMKLDPKAAAKPAMYMYALKRFSPISPMYKTIVKALQNGQTPAQVMSSQSGAAQGALKNAMKTAQLAQSGRNGLLAASVVSYMNEADAAYPTDDQILPPKIQEQPAEAPAQDPAQMPSSAIPTNTGIQAIQQIANMLQGNSIAGTGTSGLEEGASIARSAGR
jgi:hypothetical protein